jgi:integrase
MAQAEEERGRQEMTEKAKRERGEGSIYQRDGSQNWWIQYYWNGEAVRESAGTSNRSKALGILRQRTGKVNDADFVPPSQQRITVGELVKDLITWYRTIKLKERSADDAEARWKLHLEPFFGWTKASRVNVDLLRKYRAQRMSEPDAPTPTTINRELQVIRKAFRLAATEKKVGAVPCFEMADEKQNVRMVFITEADKQKLRDAAASDTSKRAKMKGLDLRCFVELLFSFGWRKGELTNLTVGSVNLTEDFIRLDTSKNGEPRECPLTPNLKVLLQAVVTGRKSDEDLFPVKDMRHAWKRLCERAGVKYGKAEGYVIHDARRTAARAKRSAGVAETVTAKIMGWSKDSKMFARYGIVDRADMVEAMKRTEQWETSQRENEHSSDTVAHEQVQVQKGHLLQ